MRGNSARGDGGGIRTTGINSFALVSDSTLSSNSAKSMAAPFQSFQQPHGDGSTLSGNSANGGTSSDGGAIWTSGGSWS